MTTDARRERAQDAGLFAALDQRGWLSNQKPALRALVQRVGRVVALGPRETLSHEGDDEQRMYGILSGYVGCLISHRHNRPMLGTVIGPGTWFGEGRLMDGGRRQVSFFAMASVRLLAIDAAALARLRADAQDFDRCFAQLPLLQVRYISQLTSELLVVDVSQRITAVLLRLCEERSEAVVLPLLQAELAEMSNASRNSVNKTLKALEREGLVSLRYGGIEVPDPSALARRYDAGLMRD